MSGWMHPAIEAGTRGAGPTSIATPIDLIDRYISEDFLSSFGNLVSFNPVRTSRAAIFVQVVDDKRHLIWDKEFFRRLLLFFATCQLEDTSQRREAFKYISYDLIALLMLQAGQLRCSVNLVHKEKTISHVFSDAKSALIRQRKEFITGTPQAWRMTNIARLFCYYHEKAHCRFAFAAGDFSWARASVNDWERPVKNLLTEAVDNIDALQPDLFHDWAARYYFMNQKNLNAAMSRLETMFKTSPNHEELACDVLAIIDVVTNYAPTTLDEFADVFVGVITTWDMYEYIETLRSRFFSLCVGIEQLELDYNHGVERNYLRGLLLLSELKRHNLAVFELDAFSTILFQRLDSVSVRFVEMSMAELHDQTEIFALSGLFWDGMRTKEKAMTFKERRNAFAGLCEYFLLTDVPTVREGVQNRTMANLLSLKSDFTIKAREEIDWSTGFATPLSVPIVPNLWHFL